MDMRKADRHELVATVPWLLFAAYLLWACVFDASMPWWAIAMNLLVAPLILWVDGERVLSVWKRRKEKDERSGG